MPSDADPGAHIKVSEYRDIDSAPSMVTGQDKDLIAQLLREGIPHGYDSVVKLPVWKVENDVDDEISFIEGSSTVAVATVQDHSDKAWRILQPHRRDEVDDHGIYAPKSQTVVFEATDRIGDLEGPQQGLDQF